MRARLETVVGWGAFVVFFLGAVAVGQQSESITIRSFSFLVGIGAGGMFGVALALATHLARGPPKSHYEPIDGDRGAWGLAEMDDAGEPRR